MATPKITDVVNGQGYKADGVQFSLNPTTGRYQEASTFQTPSTNTAMPSEVSPKMDFNSFTKPQVQGSMASPYIPTADMSPVAQATAGTAEQIVKESQAQAQNTQAAQTEQAVADYVKKYLGLSGNTSVAEQKAAETAQLTQQAGISETTSKLKDLATKMEALNIQTEAEKQAILASPIGGITSADLSGREQEITRKNNISRLNLAAESLVLQGKLDSANTAIKNAIDLKYAPQEARYKAVLEFNTINEKILGKEAEKQKDLANAKIKDLEEKKKNDTEIATMITEAIPNAPADVIYRAKKLAESGASKLAVAQSLGVYGGDYLRNELTREQLKQARTRTSTISSEGREMVTENGVPLIKVTPKEIQDLNDTQIAKNSLVSLVDNMIGSIDKYGTQVLYGTEAGTRSGAKTNLLLAMKNLEKTGALDKGTIDVLSGTIPESKFFATEAAQKAALQQLRDTVVNKTDEYINSYKGTTAETDPRTKRIYTQSGASSIVIPQGVSSAGASYAQSTMNVVGNVNNQVNKQQSYSGYDTGLKQ